MTTPTIVISSAPNPVPPGDSISVQVTVTLGTGGGESINQGDIIALALTLPAGFTVVNPEAIQFAAPPSGQPFNLTFQVAGTTVCEPNSIAWTWTNLTQGAAPVAGTNFNVTVGFSITAQLDYTITPVPPVLLARLNTAVTAVVLPHQGIQDKAGCVNLSDVTSNVGGNVRRRVTYLLPYACTQQFNGNNALPANTKTRQFFAVTTTGGTASIGSLIYDNGSGVGTTSIVPAVANLAIVAAGTASFTGGTQAFTLGHLYTWNGAAWVDGGATKIGRSAFQQSFPASAGAQSKAFAALYTSVLGGNLGTQVTAAPVVIV